jgi:ubiquinone/menaquinone biosynthesis C-methylase UbiE
MSFYSNFIMPRCIDLVMSEPILGEYRRELLSEVSGNILEIGFGTGLNLPYYSNLVEKITAIDNNSGMKKLALSRIAKSEIDVDYCVLNGENIALESSSFDAIVTTWTLCSIQQIDRALAEIYRLLKPGGKFFFIEHGLSDEKSIQVWQNRLNPLQNIIADGCHLNRPIEILVKKQFNSVSIERFYAAKIPKIIGYMYRGIAIK